MGAEGSGLAGGLVLTRQTGANVFVVGVDAVAGRGGVRAGMTLGQAHACAPGLRVLVHEPVRDAAALRRLARWAGRFSPLVEVVEPDTLLVDITGCQRLFGGEANIARQAVAGLRELGFCARAAIADTVGAAYALAWAGVGGEAARPPAEVRLYQSPIRGYAARREPRPPGALAGAVRSDSLGTGGGRCRAEGERSGPHSGPYSFDGFVVVPVGEVEACLAPLPPAALRLDGATVGRLDALGVRTIGDFLKLPRATLPARFGKLLGRRLQEALGEVHEGVGTLEPADEPVVRASFEPPAGDLLPVLAAVERLLDELLAQLGAREQLLRRMDCGLYFEDAPPVVLRVALARASRKRKHILELLTQRIEQARPGPGVTGVMLAARETARDRPGQIALFGAEGGVGEGGQSSTLEGWGAQMTEAEQGEQLGELVDRLIGRLGYRAVLRPELVDDYQPEVAFRYVPATRVGGGEGEAGAVPRMPRPVQLLERPLLIRVLAVVPDGPPTWFACGRGEYVVVAAQGPERIETGWWRGPDVRRDYFRVQAESGEQFWLFHDFGEGRWYLHGVFS